MTTQVATKLGVGTCDGPKCRCVHIVLSDDKDAAIAQVAVPIERISNLIDELRACAYRVITLKEDASE